MIRILLPWKTLVLVWNFAHIPRNVTWRLGISQINMEMYYIHLSVCGFVFMWTHSPAQTRSLSVFVLFVSCVFFANLKINVITILSLKEHDVIHRGCVYNIDSPETQKYSKFPKLSRQGPQNINKVKRYETVTSLNISLFIQLFSHENK